MLKEISLKEAVERLEKSERVPCLVPLAPDADWRQMSPNTLNGILAGVVCFAECEIEEVTEEPKPKKQRKPRIPIDKQKVIGLYASGWKINHIAEEVGCHPNTAKLIIEEEKARLDAEEAKK